MNGIEIILTGAERKLMVLFILIQMLFQVDGSGVSVCARDLDQVEKEFTRMIKKLNSGEMRRMFDTVFNVAPIISFAEII